MVQSETQKLYNGFGNTLARAFELVVTPALFGLIGYGIDRVTGLLPVFTIALTVFCLAGMSVRMYYGYVTTMKEYEANGPWARKRAAVDVESDVTP